MSKEEDTPLNRRIWCNEEDEAIKQLVHKYGNDSIATTIIPRISSYTNTNNNNNYY